MFDPTRVSYTVAAALSNGMVLDLTDACQNIGLEENKGENAQRCNLSMYNVKSGSKDVIKRLELASRFYVFCKYRNDDGSISRKELFRGNLWEKSGSYLPNDSFTVTAYDDLMYLNKSKISKFYPAGFKTQDIMAEICKEYGIPLGKFQAGNFEHDKLSFKAKTIAAAFKELLDANEKKGGPKCFLRFRTNKMDVLGYGMNETIYVLDSSNTTENSFTASMTDMITSVTVMSTAGDDEKSAIEAVVTGAVRYGLMNEIVECGDESLESAKQSAQAILDEKGVFTKTRTITAVNIPYVRKGDLVYLNIEGMKACYAEVLGVSHDISAMTMQLEVELVDE